MNQRENLALDQESLRALFPTPLQLLLDISYSFYMGLRLIVIISYMYCTAQVFDHLMLKSTLEVKLLFLLINKQNNTSNY